MAGETILIHAAAGGVGQAAIRYAQHIGAEIFVTLSTAAKRDVSSGPEDQIRLR
jgi:NADPH:quinone reductase-like Zn-dependent oxidoreductase